MTVLAHTKVTRQDWLDAAMSTLIETGVEQVKVLTLATRMGVSRSSFYWYFKSRADLLDGLLAAWEAHNPAAMIAQAELPSQSICEAICNIHKCVVNPALFDIPLDFAVRDWARRDASVKARVTAADARTCAALAAMFTHHDYDPQEALIRARVLYYMQLGYDAAELNESWEERLANVSHYLLAFTGRPPRPEVVADFAAYARAHTGENS
ncbi:MAG: TetR/AcrR family transcriptional regulator [Rhodobacteraceae bacterium]|nr:TetR/AcrR family transcriptional regulator [Paracoccaceae bacterium]